MTYYVKAGGDFIGVYQEEGAQGWHARLDANLPHAREMAEAICARLNGEAVTGKTLRDEFAMAALASMTTAPDYSKGPCNSAMVERAYIIADLMLAARSAQPAKETT